MGPEEATPITTACVEDCKEGTHGYGCPYDGDPIQPAAPTKVEETKKPTRKEIGEWRARNFTVRHATVVACDHKLDLRRIPTTHCFDCWYAFLESNPEGIASVHELLQQGGTKAVEAMHGKKFVKMYGSYIQEKLLKLRAASEPQPESTIEGSQLEVLDIAKEAQNAQNNQISS